MLITRETDYAIRTIRALSNGELLTVKQICEKEHIPTQFAYKILKKLQKANLIQITRGAAGGYRLIADLSKLNLFDLLMAMGEDGLVNECLKTDYQCVNNCEGVCKMHQELLRIQNALNAELRRNSIISILHGG